MNFFEHQDLARRNTRLLVVLFGLAVICIIASLYVVAAWLIAPDHKWWYPELAFIVTLVTVAIVGLGTGFKLLQLSSGGGVAVAESLGGRPIPPNTTDLAERRLLNVVEEMAIASGVPTPPVYLLDEEGINAFAAGRTPEEAVIGVTRGTMTLLTREQLQGVIAHEFSHILNGDMWMNMRLIGVLHGILVISLVGQVIFRSMAYSGMARSRSSRRDGDNSGAFIMIMGLAMMLLGWIGVFFGSLIKAAVSRQREFLADASAVQFTRNPEGIGGALKAIGAHHSHGLIEAPKAAEASHMFFATGVANLFSNPFATHPPLEQRIGRLLPNWDGNFGKPPKVASFMEPTPPPIPQDARGSQPLSVADWVGRPGMMQLAVAAELLGSLDHDVRTGVREPAAARALICCLLLSEDEAVRDKQWQLIREHSGERVFILAKALENHIVNLKADARLTVIDLAIPALKQLSQNDYQTFKANLKALIAADDRVSLFEWTLERLVLHHLRPTFEGAQHPQRTRAMKPPAAMAVALSAIAHYGVIPEMRVEALKQAREALGLPDLKIGVWRQNWEELNLATASLDQCAPQRKLEFLEASAACILSDGQVQEDAVELLRAISDLIGCPMPPLST